MRIEEKFTVAAPADDVWAFLTDPERVAAALPGAEITERSTRTPTRAEWGSRWAR